MAVFCFVSELTPYGETAAKEVGVHPILVWWRRGESPLACGLGQGTALTVHQTVIHYRTQFDSLFTILNQNKKAPWRVLFVLVEARRVELLSENLSTGFSPSAVYLLKFPIKTADKQAILKGIPWYGVRSGNPLTLLTTLIRSRQENRGTFSEGPPL